jgi:hypothetical protein
MPPVDLHKLADQTAELVGEFEDLGGENLRVGLRREGGGSFGCCVGHGAHGFHGSIGRPSSG